MIVEAYQEMLVGNPIGVSGGLGGMIPEKLLWTTIRSYVKQTRLKLNRWALNLIYMLDSIRLNAEFDRMKKEAEKSNNAR